VQSLKGTGRNVTLMGKMEFLSKLHLGIARGYMSVPKPLVNYLKNVLTNGYEPPILPNLRELQTASTILILQI
jgi:hypothetical protein